MSRPTHRRGLERALGSRYGRRLGAALALAAVRVATRVVVGANSPRAPRCSSPDASKPGMAAVEWRDLLETDTESGTLSYTSSHPVYTACRPRSTSRPAVGQLIKHHHATRDHRAK